MAERIALYGGSFNPIHHAHLIIAREIAERLELNRVVFLPSARPPHKGAETLIAPAHRAEMVKLAIHSEPMFEFSDFDLARDEPSYTIDAVMHFRAVYGDEAELFWIIGADSLAELITWHRVGELVDACEIITASRPEWEDIPWDALATALGPDQIKAIKKHMLRTPLLELSSTVIRRRLRMGLSVRYMVPDSVLGYINKHAICR
ncbi:MAG: nicotinate-nucleotide adenylyltransferase [Phycisphaerae bacterium]